MDARYDYRIHLREYVTGPMRSITQSSKVGRASVSGVNRSLTQTSRKSVLAGSALRQASESATILGRNSRAATPKLVQLERGLDHVGDEALEAERKMIRFGRASQRAMSQARDENGRFVASARRSTSSMRQMRGGVNSLGALGPTLAGVFAVDRVVDFGSAVVDTLGSFETMEAVLTNTLGNNSQAKVVLRDISNFAAVTPFQVDELTQSWIKLGNDGFRPTMAQMTLLGDLAASRGKSMDQLVEAHMDAKRFEFERLKEFGISTKVQGDKIAFTFKNQTTVVKKSSQAVDNYMLSLGKLEGVQGGMAAISATTAGQVSNLSDKWTTFKLLIGETFENEISGGIKSLSDLVDGLKEVAMWTDLNKGAFKAMGEALLPVWELTKHIVAPDQGTILRDKISDPIMDAFNPRNWGIPGFGQKNKSEDSPFKFKSLDRTGNDDRQTQMAEWVKGQFGFQTGQKGAISPFIAAKPPIDSPYGVDGAKGSLGGSKTKTKEDRLASVIGGGRSGVKNITINIEALNKGGITISTTNLKEGVQQIKRRLEEMLLSVANDANYAS